MSEPLVTAAESAADIRWAEWQARGLEGDRRRAIVLRRLFAIVALIVGGWVIVALR